MSGYLNITLNNSTQGDPINGAKVLITEHGNRQNVLRELTTDISGQVNYVELDSGNGEDGLVYKKYDLIIQNPNYLTNDNRPYEYTKSGVQIWKETVTINQDEFSQILKIDQLSAETRNNIIQIPDNDAFTQVESMVDQDPLSIPDPQFIFPVVPFIPTEISIYLGKVNPYVAGASTNPKKILNENYKKYLKMVATQEFGGIPGLTENAAIANLLLLNSFALNRVYTEMYRNKGYDFTITNSTSFDQHYPVGGIIFEKISSIVDEHFFKFIKVNGKKQPLLAQYCAGKHSPCANGGISQWGLQYESREHESLSYEELLKKMYSKMGVDIEIVTAEVIQGNPKSFPGYVLHVGMKDNNVKTIQEFLNTIGTKYSKIKPLDITGEFNEETKEGIVAFQNIFEKNKKNKGEIDETTWYTISGVYVEITKMDGNRSRYMKAFMY